MQAGSDTTFDKPQGVRELERLSSAQAQLSHRDQPQNLCSEVAHGHCARLSFHLAPLQPGQSQDSIQLSWTGMD